MLNLLTNKETKEYIRLEFMGENACLYAQTVKNISDENIDLIAIVKSGSEVPLHVVYTMNDDYYDVNGKIASTDEELKAYIQKEFNVNADQIVIANKYKTNDILFDYNGYDTDNYHQLLPHLRDLEKKRFEQYCDEESGAYKKLAQAIEDKHGDK